MAGKRYIRIILLYAAIVFAGEHLYLELLHLLGILYDEEGLILGYLSMVIMFVAFYLCLRQLNHKIYNSKTPVVPLLLNGLLLTVVSVVITLLFHNLELYVFRTYPHEELLEAARERLEKQQLSETEIEVQLQKIKAHYFTFKSQWGLAKWYLKYGILYTLVFITFFKLKQLLNNKSNENNSITY